MLLSDMGLATPLSQWIKATVEDRLAAATLNDSFRRVVVRSVPQEGALSPLLWCLIDDLIACLNGVGVYSQAYAHDISFARREIHKHGVVGTHAVGPSHRRDLVRRDRFVG